MTRPPIAMLLLSTLIAGAADAAPSPRLWPFWAESQPASTVIVDHGPWQQFLTKHLEEGEDGINRIAYAAVDRDDRRLLQAYLDTLASLDPRELRRDEQLAYWINLYNALTVEIVLRHPDKGSILRMGRGLFSIGPWKDELIEIAGKPMSLDDIEHRVLRPIWQDHRVHYAVNCASLGCPNLNPEAFTADNTQLLLAAAEAEFVNHPRAVSFTDDGKLRLSTLFKWYRVDFAPNEQALLAHLAERHDSLGERLAGYRRAIEYHYDWNLNAVEPR